jgi:uncharacterized protein YhhL (DUF1145 family)
MAFGIACREVAALCNILFTVAVNYGVQTMKTVFRTTKFASAKNVNAAPMFRRLILLVSAAAIALLGSTIGHAQPRGPRWDKEREADMGVFHYLLDHRKEITRKVTKVPTGVETVTESDRPEVAKNLHVHVEAMHKRLLKGRPIHMRDPLFREIFRHADQITLRVENTPKGVKVSETSKEPYVAKLIQAHADVLNEFLAKGHEEVRKNHPLPPW